MTYFDVSITLYRSYVVYADYVNSVYLLGFANVPHFNKKQFKSTTFVSLVSLKVREAESIAQELRRRPHKVLWNNTAKGSIFREHFS